MLVLVPSLALLSQTLRAWVDDTELPSAPSLSARTARPDVRAGAPTTPRTWMSSISPILQRLTRRAWRKPPDPTRPAGMTVVLATYQSSGVLEEAQQRQGLPAFDLAIADEAHRTAGALIPGEDPSPFVRIHDNEAIRAGRRL